MVRLHRTLPVLATTLLLGSLALSAIAADVPDSSLPVHMLVESADALLAAGDKRAALDHFNVAIEKDPSNYLTIFKRGAAYLSLGRNAQAVADFDSVLDIKPDFEAALVQRAKLKARSGDWDGARADYNRAGGSRFATYIEEIDAAENAATEARAATKHKDWEKCIEKAGIAIPVAGGDLELRNLRARCRLQAGNALEAVTDLQQALILNPSDITPHLYIANLLFYSLNDFDRAKQQLLKCLHSDPDSKSCSKLLRRFKNYNKSLTKVRDFRTKRSFASLKRTLLVPTDEDEPDLFTELTNDIKDLETPTTFDTNLPPFHSKLPHELTAELNEIACETYTELKKPKQAAPYCDETLRLNPASLPATLAKAASLVSSELFEEAVRMLSAFRDAHQGVTESSRVFSQKFREAQTLLKRSKEKDYYKVLGVSRDADDRTIKRAYRNLVKQYHPDKYRGELNEEEVQSKMSAINEAWEVLSNPELKERFDNGDDPNSNEQQGNPFGGGNPFAQWGHQGGGPFMFRQQGGFDGFGGGGQHFKFNF
ncbi:DnaJ and TPR domain protein [Ascodesmis nigricans]|uniref:DnaJ and TPR domain protein n=1 Tax=Ascodesmis nigricans TaxID=341454 RepID=A0A4S2MUN0_9PEZI|nr:DnaJ and TPR domain protein [Ascodesmis nigricans]